jgi:quercetin dioxygenase-like cupin family protein
MSRSPSVSALRRPPTADLRRVSAEDPRRELAAGLHSEPAADLRWAPAADLHSEPAADLRWAPAEDLHSEPAADLRWAPAAGLAPDRLRAFVTTLAREPHRWRHLVRHERDTRIYEQLFSDARLNAWLICWSTGQDTGFHDHDESAGSIAVIRGHVRDERLALGGPPSVREFAAGQHFAIAPNAIHRVTHAGAEPAVTIHAYSPPLRRMGAYRVGPAGELERQALTCEQELCAERGLDLLAGARSTA